MLWCILMATLVVDPSLKGFVSKKFESCTTADSDDGSLYPLPESDSPFQGPEIRTGFLANKKSAELTRGDELELTTDYDFLGDHTKVRYRLILVRLAEAGSMISASFYSCKL